MGLAAAMIDYGDFEKHRQAYSKMYAPGLLVPEEHHRLVVDLPKVSKVARVPQHFIYRHRMADYCGVEEIEWVKKLRNTELSGLVYVGTTPHVEERMLAIAGACIRNFIDARLYTVQQVVDIVRAGKEPPGRVILIPNFHLSKTTGGDLPSWQVSGLLGVLYSRFAEGLFTVIYVASMKMLEKDYGKAFADHITQHFAVVQE